MECYTGFAELMHAGAHAVVVVIVFVALYVAFGGRSKW